MLRIFDDLAEARRTVLKRMPLDEYPISPRVQAGIEKVFGEPLSPEDVVRRIIGDVRARGDAALSEWTRRLDGTEVLPEQLRIPCSEVEAAYDQVEPGLVEAMRAAASRIEAFHRRQPVSSWIDTTPAGTLGQVVRPVGRVAVYAPAGTAPLPSSMLMSAIPARVAGVPEIVACTPPDRTGKANPVVLVAADLAGVKTIYRMGGAQAIAALAFGTETVAAVDKIVGPGNVFVVLAKRAVFGVVGIDGIPGPTETVVIADRRADPAWAAADLLAQAEHDVLASAILLTPDRDMAEKVRVEVGRQMESLSRAEIIAESLTNRGGIVLVRDLAEAVTVANEYAAEHLCLLVEDPWRWVPLIQNAGGIFLGEHSFEVLGDYVAGPSHVMPTGGTARFASPLNVLDFVKWTSLISLGGPEAAALSRTAERIALAEGLTAHAAAARQRIRDNKG